MLFIMGDVKPLLLVILDGWGYRQSHDNNAIAQAKTPHWDDWWAHAPRSLLQCSGSAVGLPDQQMGNSEVGHMHIGAGRIVKQDYVRINDAIADGSFAENRVLNQMIRDLVVKQQALHILGLLSSGGVHSHEHHIHAAVKLAAKMGVKRCYVHAFLDGRDTPPQSAQASLETLQALLNQLGIGSIASISGRYYAMDRDKRWERTQKVYDLLTLNQADYFAENALSGLAQAYQRGETDEFVVPTLTRPDTSPIEYGDSVLFMNFRADRARQLSYALAQDTFTDFQRRRIVKLSHFASLTSYAEGLTQDIVFPKLTLRHTLGECLAEHKLAQLRIAETEKYAHVTFFLNGGVETPFEGEERILVPSPQVATYDLQPTMSALELSDQLIEALASKKYAVIIANYANADMVGHSGNMAATIQAVECLDQCLTTVHRCCQQVGGEMLITADHGNAECMYNNTTQQVHTAHTAGPVPLVYLGSRKMTLRKRGSLIDIAPTMLALLGLPVPSEMTGGVLFTPE